MLAITFNNVLAIEHIVAVGHHHHAQTSVASEPATTSSKDTSMSEPSTPAPQQRGSGHTHGKKGNAAVSKAPVAPLPSDESDSLPAQTAESTKREGSHGALHVQHCHVSPATCAEQPVPTGPGQMLFAEPLLQPVRLQLRAAEESTTSVVGISIDLKTPPPRV